MTLEEYIRLYLKFLHVIGSEAETIIAICKSFEGTMKDKWQNDVSELKTHELTNVIKQLDCVITNYDHGYYNDIAQP